MGVLIPSVLPVLPGQSDRVRNFEKELEPHREHDSWWLDYLRDVHGIDLRGVPLDRQPSPPPPVFVWTEG